MWLIGSVDAVHHLIVSMVMNGSGIHHSGHTALFFVNLPIYVNGSAPSSIGS